MREVSVHSRSRRYSVGPGAASGVQAQAQRSAQSDCAREAERRGYTTLSTRNFQQYKDGWSMDLQARDRAGRVSWGIVLRGDAYG